MAGLSLLIAAVAQAHPGPGIVVNAKGELYFVDGFRNRIMKVDAAAKMTIFRESKEGKDLDHPHHLVLGPKGDLYAVADDAGPVWKINTKGEMTAIYSPKKDQDKLWVGLNGYPFTIDGDGNLYFVPGGPPNNSRIYKMSRDGTVTGFAGGRSGHADGKGARARFGDLYTGCFAWGPKGELYLTDSRSCVRKITKDGNVTTLAGGPDRGFADGSGKEAKFDGAHGVTCDAHGNLYVADHSNRRIRKIASDGTVTTLAGSGKTGFDDGPALKATFKGPIGVAVSKGGGVYVLDYSTDDLGPTKVRKISREGTVTTMTTIERGP
jgi:sugar lactone lactonase YvrE